MSDKKRAFSLFARAILVLISAAGLWFLWTRFLSTSILNASGNPRLMLSTFQSPIGDPELNLVKSVDNNTPQPGDVIEYSLTYSTTNPGSQAFNVRLYDFLPTGVEAVEPTAPDGVIMFTIPSISASNGITTVRVRVKEGYEQLNNQALMMADFLTPTYASLVTNVDQPPLWLSLRKRGTTYVLTDSIVIYELRCVNASDITVNDVTVVDILPPDLSLVGASPAPAISSPPLLQWNVGDLEPGPLNAWEAIITTTSPASAGLITNTALADARQRVMTQTMFNTHVLTKAAILQVSKSGPKVVDLGDELVYTLRYENIGNLPATGVTLTDTLPSDINVTGTSITATTTTSEYIIWDLGTLSPTHSSEIVITATVEGMGGRMLHNVADLTSQSESFPDQDDQDTWVQLAIIYLPIVTRNYDATGE